MKNLLKIIFISALLLPNLSLAENQQDFVMNSAECKRYIDLSREEIESGNLSLARAYAMKAIQANAWDKLAWANYDDIIQRLADEGDIPDYGTVVEESESSGAPQPSQGEAQFEGC